MKILVGYVNNNLTGGIDKVIVKFAKYLSNKKNIQIDFMTKLEENEFHQELRDNGHQVFHIPRNKHFLKAIKETKRIIRENNYDIVYVNISESFDCSALIAAKQLGVTKRIVHSHNSSKKTPYPIVTFFIKLLQWIFKSVLSYTANEYIACSIPAAEWMFTKKIVKNKEYEIINNSIDSKRFAFSKESRDKIRKKYKVENGFVLGFIGRFDKQKNNNFLLDILKDVIKTRDAYLICVGDGPEEENFINHMKKLHLEDRAIMAGTTKHPEEFYSAFDVFILPSIYEGLPIVGVEAQFNGCPCIFSDRITEEVIIGKNSYLESIKSTLPWANRINKIESRENKLTKDAEKFKVENDNFDNIIDLKNIRKK